MDLAYFQDFTGKLPPEQPSFAMLGVFVPRQSTTDSEVKAVEDGHHFAASPHCMHIIFTVSLF